MSAIARGLGIGPESHPKILRSISRRPNEAERQRYIELQKLRDAKATELAIDPTLIASRAVLSDLASNWDKYSGELMNWQKELLKG